MQEHIAAAPFRVTRPRLVQPSEPEAVPEAEYERLIAAARASNDPRQLAAILLAGDAGLRCAELLRLQWEDLTLEAVEGLSGIITRRLREALDAVAWPGRVGQILAGLETVYGVRHLAERVWERARLAGIPEGAEAGPSPRTVHLHQLRHRFGIAPTRAS